jgi:methionine-rich copper-binding protein CopC
MSTMRRLTLALSLLLLLGLAGAAYAHFKVSKTEPADGAVVDRPVRDLRVWFSQEPDVALSQLELVGPSGALEVQGVHTMGEKDLMGSVVGAMPDGEYTVKWRAAGDDGHVLDGEWKFTVKRASR